MAGTASILADRTVGALETAAVFFFLILKKAGRN